jgi:hypothetical protein
MAASPCQFFGLTAAGWRFRPVMYALVFYKQLERRGEL